MASTELRTRRPVTLPPPLNLLLLPSELPPLLFPLLAFLATAPAIPTPTMMTTTMRIIVMLIPATLAEAVCETSWSTVLAIVVKLSTLPVCVPSLDWSADALNNTFPPASTEELLQSTAPDDEFASSILMLVASVTELLIVDDVLDTLAARARPIP
jgi:hypothetical protein